MEITPYLFFEGRCEEALAFYHETIGAETLALMRYKDSPEPDNPCGVSPENQDKVMHACFRVGATTIMASDGFCAGKPDFQGFSLSLNAPDETTAQQMFTRSAEHTSELQSLMRISYAVFCLKKKKNTPPTIIH